VAEGSKHVADLSFSPVVRNVLHVDVVDELSERSSVLWLEPYDGDTFRVALEIASKGSLSSVLLLEADEAVASGRVVFVERNLQTLDLSDGLEKSLEVFMLQFLWNLDENVVIVEFLLVASKELAVER